MVRKEIAWLNKNVDMVPFLEELGVKVPPNGVMFCCFHENTETPAAKYFEDTNKVFCFSESKLFGTYEVMKLLKYSNDKIKTYIDYSALEDFEVDFSVMKFPVVDDETKALAEKNIFDYLDKLNHLWKNREDVNCQLIV